MRALPLCGVIVAGAVVLAVAGNHVALLALGFALVALALVGITSLFFYEIGRSEDRDRARERQRRTR